ncbi:hypothetical protein JW905_06205, partial [bacterium]|nr:hypothetical protein [candidate division CSSED10-310 bacterium]
MKDDQLVVELAESARSANISLMGYLDDAPVIRLTGLIPMGARRTETIMEIGTLPGWEMTVREAVGAGRADLPPEETLLKGHATAIQQFTIGADGYLLVASGPEPVQFRSNADNKLYLKNNGTIQEVILRLDVERGRLYACRLSVPAGLQVERVACGVPHRYAWLPEPDPRVLVNFLSGVTGSIEVRMELSGPPFTPGEVFSGVPCVMLGGGVRQQADLQLMVEDSYEIEVKEVRKGRSVTCDDSVRRAGARRCYRFEEQPGEVRVVVTPRIGQIEARAAVAITANEAGLDIAGEYRFDIVHGMVSRLVFEIPAGMRDVRFEGEFVRVVSEATLDGMDVRVVELLKPEDGEVEVQMACRVAVADDGWALAGIPRPLDVARFAGTTAVLNESMGELQFGDAMGIEWLASVGDKAESREFRFSDAGWLVPVRVTALESAEMHRAAVAYVHVTSEVRESGIVRHAVAINMNNKREQYLRLRLPSGARLLNLLVASRRVGISTQEGDLLIPLIRTAPWESSFMVELLYEVAGEHGWGFWGGKRFTAPEVIGVPVARTFWTLYLPADRSLFWLRGNMERSFLSEIESVRVSSLVKDQERIIEKFDEMTAEQQALATDNLYQLNEMQTQSTVGVNSILNAERYHDRIESRQQREMSKELGRLESSAAALRRQIDALRERQAAGVTTPPAPEQKEPPEELYRFYLAEAGVPYYFMKLKGGAVVSFRTGKGRALRLLAAAMWAVCPVVLGFVLFTGGLRRWVALWITRRSTLGKVLSIMVPSVILLTYSGVLKTFFILFLIASVWVAGALLKKIRVRWLGP